jgi:hypothetical protein
MVFTGGVSSLLITIVLKVAVGLTKAAQTLANKSNRCKLAARMMKGVG